MTELGIQLEHEALDRIHGALRTNKRGLRVGQIANLTGLAIGFVHEILQKSECVLKRRPRHPRLWWADWSDLEEDFRPVFKAGRPKGTQQICPTKKLAIR